jgi:DNA-binding TFAR19-related protein (PDSD5 family)
MINMSDSELAAIRRNKLRELKRRLSAKQKKTEEIDADKILNGLFKGRAGEIFNAASYQFPNVMQEVKKALVKLAQSGRLRAVTGEQLHLFLKTLGLRVRLDTKIRYAEHGKLKSLADKMKDDLKKPNTRP